MLPTTMRALQVTALEGPEAIQQVELPVPKPGPGQVLVRVHAAGVNFADVMQTRGLYVGGPTPPYTPGLEGCGEVVAVGAGVDGYLGTRVMAFGPGAFAEYAVWPAAGLLPVPDGWSDGQGASFPVQWFTAYGCLELGRLKAGETVLIHAAAGGVGTAAVKLAKARGARVLGTASTPEKLELARSLGADVGINYLEQDFMTAVQRETDGKGVDLILEMVGGETFTRNLDAVRPYGRIVVFGAASAQQATVDNVSLIFRPLELIGYHLAVLATRRPDLFAGHVQALTGLVQSGVAVPAQPTAFPLEQAADALTRLENRQTTGKLVLKNEAG